jgi:hypothetical protein
LVLQNPGFIRNGPAGVIAQYLLTEMNVRWFQNHSASISPNPGIGWGVAPMAMALRKLVLPAVFGLWSPSMVCGQGVNPLTITPVTPHTFRLDWQEISGRTQVLEASSDLVSWGDPGLPTVEGTGGARSLVFTSSAPRVFFHLRDGAIRPGFNTEILDPNDDDSSTVRALPFVVNFLGTEYGNCYVNNNGNITFGGSLAVFTPEDMRLLDAQIIAPFWADVDTRSAKSGVTRYSQSVGSPNYHEERVDGHRAFGVTYAGVGYYNLRPEKLNSFQVILIEREDLGAGDFDVEFNYNRIQWETGDVDGTDGYGGISARVGISGRGPKANRGLSMEVAGSGNPGSFLDKIVASGLPNNPSGLIYRKWNTPVPGRLVFQFRGGVLNESINVDAGDDISLPRTASKSVTLSGQVNVVGGGSYSLHWNQTSGAPATISDPTSLTPVVTLPQPGYYTFSLRGITNTVPQFSSFDEMKVYLADEVLTVDAGNPVTSPAGAPLTLTLTGHVSFTRNDPINVCWVQDDGEPATIGAPNALDTTVSLPGPGYYSFRLTATTVHDGRTFSESAFAYVFREEDVLTVQAGDAVHLDGAAPLTVTLAGQATFTGGGAISTVWTQSSGDPAAISDTLSLNPVVTLPGPGTYLFTLTATTGGTPPVSSSSTVSIVHDAP